MDTPSTGKNIQNQIDSIQKNNNHASIEGNIALFGTFLSKIISFVTRTGVAAAGSQKKSNKGEVTEYSPSNLRPSPDETLDYQYIALPSDMTSSRKRKIAKERGKTEINSPHIINVNEIVVTPVNEGEPIKTLKNRMDRLGKV